MGRLIEYGVDVCPGPIYLRALKDVALDPEVFERALSRKSRRAHRVYAPWRARLCSVSFDASRVVVPV